MRKISHALVVLLGIGCIITVIFALTTRDQWWMRMFDYPRLQIAILSLGLLLISLLFRQWHAWWNRIYLALLLLAVGYQGYILAPYYLPVAPVVPTHSVETSTRTFSLLSANVLMENRDVEAFVEIVERTEPDLLLIIEPNQWWLEQLQPLHDRYPHRIEQPQENHYGMALYSRFPLRDHEILYLETENVPAIVADVALPTGDLITFYGEHPRPPLPENSVTAADKELIRVAERIRAAQQPVIVAGDFNDVPWSYTVEKFAAISQLRDPRVGRGFYHTFDAQSPIMRVPIDHIFVSPGVALVELADPIRFSSDHFALFARFAIHENLE